MAKRMLVDQLLRLACVYAEQDRESWLVAMDNCRGTPEDAEAIAKAEAFLAQLRKYRLRRWGKTQLEKTLEGAVPVSPAEVIRNLLEREKTK